MTTLATGDLAGEKGPRRRISRMMRRLLKRLRNRYHIARGSNGECIAIGVQRKQRKQVASGYTQEAEQLRKQTAELMEGDDDDDVTPVPQSTHTAEARGRLPEQRILIVSVIWWRYMEEAMTMGNVTHGRSVQLSPTALLHCLPMSQVVANPEPQQR